MRDDVQALSVMLTMPYAYAMPIAMPMWFCLFLQYYSFKERSKLRKLTENPENDDSSFSSKKREGPCSMLWCKGVLLNTVYPLLMQHLDVNLLWKLFIADR